MSIQVDWKVDADRESVPVSGPDPEEGRRKRRAALRFILVLLIFIALVTLAVTAVVLRLRYQDWTTEQALRDTIASEVTALRFGDRALFQALQRSAAPDWDAQQMALFDRYQTLKQERDISLTGRVLDIAVDGQRGRALVEEVIDGDRYGRLWFFWRYDDGWFQVPPDFTFWGGAGQITGDRVELTYQALDQAQADSAARVIDGWLERACTFIACPDGDRLTVAITPGADVPVGWRADGSGVLELPSAWTRDASMDSPFDPVMQLEAANLIARRLTEQATAGLMFATDSDAEFLRRAASSWLVGQFLGVASASPLMDSLAQAYGPDAVGRLLATLSPGADLTSLAASAGATSVDALQVDWRDYLTWRLSQAGVSLQVEAVTRSADAAGNPLLVADGTLPDGTAGQAVFALINGRWERTA